MLERSYSRHSRVISDEIVTGMLGQGSYQRVAHGLLVRRICVRVQEADGDRLDTVAPARVDDRLQVVEFERPEHDAVTVDALAHLEAVPAGNERRRLPRDEVVHVRPVPAADLEHVAEAMRRDERSTGALAARSAR